MRLKKKWSMLLLGFSLLWLISCNEKKQNVSESYWDKLTDSLEMRYMDSLFSNTVYSRNLLLSALPKMPDSVNYYRLQSLYAKSFFVSADFDSVRYYFIPVKAFERRGYKSPQAFDVFSDVYNMEGNVWMQLSQPDSALIYYQKAYDRRLFGRHVSYLPDICINMADASMYKGRLDSSAYYNRRALLLCDSLNLPEHKKFPIYCGLGQVYMELRDFDLSNYYFEMGGKFFPSMSVAEKATYLNNRGNHYYFKKDYLTSLHYIRQAYQVVEPYPQMIFQKNLSRANLGELFVRLGRLDSARIYLDEAYRYFSGIKNNSAVYSIESQMIELALKEGNLSLAQEMIRRTLPAGHIDANMLNVRNEYLQHYFEQTGDYKRAYEYQKQDLKLNDSIRNERVRTRVAELDMRYRQDTIVLRKELQIERQAGEMEVLRLGVYIWILVCVALVAGLIVIIWYMRKKRQFLRERFVQQTNRIRMENLRSRISPHFTFNVLGREINQLKGAEDVRSHLMDLVKYLRSSLELTEKLSVSLREELDFVQNYIGLERGRLGDDFDMSMVVDGQLDTDRILLPSMIIQIPVENAIKHGLTGLDYRKKLSIDVSREDDGVRILITDNGRGYLPQSISDTRGTGTGLKVLFQTIQLLNAKNKSTKIRFEIVNLNDGQRTGTQVLVYVPFRYSYDL